MTMVPGAARGLDGQNGPDGPDGPDGEWSSAAATVRGWRSSVHRSWLPVLEPVAPAFAQVAATLAREEAAGIAVVPPPRRILRALGQPLERIRVVIVGQDPYPTPGHAVGLSFSVDSDVRPVPRSLANIYAELHADLGLGPVTHGDLGAWEQQGVLLLNRVLTTRAGTAGAHRKLGWEHITDAVVARLGQDPTVVIVLWGNDARGLRSLISGAAVIESAHPSPLSARRGFLGSRPFGRINSLLRAAGQREINWELPDAQREERLF